MIDATQAVALLAETYTPPSAAQSKANIIAIAKAADPPVDVSSFVVGDPTERWIEISGQAMSAWNAVPIAATMSVFFALATDPGDVDDFGTSDLADQADDEAGLPRRPPRAGFLSAYGLGAYGVERGGQTFAESVVTIRNDGAAATLPIPVGGLTFEYSAASRSDSGTPTYITTADASLYTGIGSTLPPLAVGATVDLPVQAVQAGVYGSAPLNGIDVCVNGGSYGTLTVVSSTTATGQEREARADYIARCVIEADKLATGGPGNAYRFAMSTGADGKPLQRHDGSGPVTILSARSYVSSDSSTGVVTVYYAGPDGPVDSVDVDSADANITGVSLGVITNPLGVLPDCVTFTSASCTATTIAVTYSAKIKASAVPGGASPGTYTSGGGPPTNVAAIFDAIEAAIGEGLIAIGIGGVDQTAGVGVVYTSDIQDMVKDAQAGLYAVSVTTPGTSTTAIALGHIATAGAISGTLVVV